MHAAVYDRTGGPEVLYYAEVADPVLRKGGVLIDVAAVSIQGGDLLHRSGGLLPSTPHIVGYQAAGTVRAVGDGVTDFEVGQPVVATMGAGSHAEIVSVPAGSVYAVPDGLSLDQAAAIPIEFGTADDCLFEFGHLQRRRDRARPGRRRWGRAGGHPAGQGGRVRPPCSPPRRARPGWSASASTAWTTASTTRKQDVGREVMRLTDGRGVDLVVDPVGGRTLEGSIAALAYRGRISWVGNAGREDDPPQVWPLMQKNASLTGVFLGAEMGMNPARVRTMIESLLARAAAGELTSVVDKEFPLEQAAEAHRYIEGSPGLRSRAAPLMSVGWRRSGAPVVGDLRSGRMSRSATGTSARRSSRNAALGLRHPVDEAVVAAVVALQHAAHRRRPAGDRGSARAAA